MTPTPKFYGVINLFPHNTISSLSWTWKFGSQWMSLLLSKGMSSSFGSRYSVTVLLIERVSFLDRLIFSVLVLSLCLVSCHHLFAGLKRINTTRPVHLFTFLV
jgi:hypothetical protein